MAQELNILQFLNSRFDLFNNNPDQIDKEKIVFTHNGQGWYLKKNQNLNNVRKTLLQTYPKEVIFYEPCMLDDNSNIFLCRNAQCDLNILFTGLSHALGKGHMIATVVESPDLILNQAKDILENKQKIY